MKYQPTIGLEIHVQLATSAKMFCRCQNVSKANTGPAGQNVSKANTGPAGQNVSKANTGPAGQNDLDYRAQPLDFARDRPNTYICPVCLGYPGTLPVFNPQALEMGLKTALVLGAKVASPMEFSRKNYFYPDLPKGYQISQHHLPLAEGGSFLVDFLSEDKKSRREFRVRLVRVHLEEDTAKMIHEKHCTLLDFNRAGVPLMEIVTQPDLHSPREARLFAQCLQELLRTLGVSNADMELGQMRIDANVSVAKPEGGGSPFGRSPAGRQKLGTKVEIKNINSFVSLEKALTYEIGRQVRELSAGRKIIQETRGWDARKGESIPQRTKEFSADYRYFPEPDLPPVGFEENIFKAIQKTLPSFPSSKRKEALALLSRPEKIYALSDIGQLEIFFALASCTKKLDLLASWLLLLEAQKLSLELHSFLLKKNWGINEMQLWAKIYSKSRSRAQADRGIKSLLVRYKKLASDLKPVVEKIIREYPDIVTEFIRGREQALKFLVGQVMKETGGKADAVLAEKLIRERTRT